MAAQAIFPLQQWLPTTNQNSVSANDNALAMEAWSGPAIALADADPGGTPADHDQYVIRTAWSTYGVGNILIYLGGTWHEFAGVNGMAKAIDGVNYVRVGGIWIVAPMWTDAPADATSPGSKGQIAFDSGYFYVCFADSSWARAALSTW